YNTGQNTFKSGNLIEFVAGYLVYRVIMKFIEIADTCRFFPKDVPTTIGGKYYDKVSP
ncbi:hypothetical protein HHI36_023660, partial [Cryptolaemus montrouzieri]